METVLEKLEATKLIEIIRDTDVVWFLFKKKFSQNEYDYALQVGPWWRIIRNNRIMLASRDLGEILDGSKEFEHCVFSRFHKIYHKQIKKKLPLKVTEVEVKAYGDLMIKLENEIEIQSKVYKTSETEYCKFVDEETQEQIILYNHQEKS